MINRLSWIFLTLLGAATIFIAYSTLRMGSVINIGSAVYPIILAGIIFLVSLHCVIFGDDEAPRALNIRGFAGVVASVVVFIAAVEHIGMVPTVVLSMLVAYAGQSKGGYTFFLVYAVLFGLATWLLFTVALGLPVPAFEMP
ncbi:MAG: tripartite tricarboxylate transporter TctB family protein [Rhodospirillales bacterium]|nr:tripartite tricarboxylate transporter TctB family protein [Rhodospirillales bacterium]